jgi:hypothetical protein
MLDIAARATWSRWVLVEMNRKVKPRVVCRRRAQLIRMMIHSREPKQDLPKANPSYDADVLRGR